jgi:formylglycine-generating enzyme required for sulfatase activity
MGSDEGSDAERPVREIHLESFCMDEAPVTNSRFARFVAETGYQSTAEETGGAWGYHDGKYTLIESLSWRSYATPDREHHPVVLVSWHDARAFAAWAGKQLPTEAQWEKAARGGLISQRYPWGDQPPVSQCGFAQATSEFPATSMVKSFSPNPYGLYDMVGNVWQWCADPYGPYHDSGVGVPATDPERKAIKVRRGGAWNVIQPFRLRCSNRGAMDALSAVPNLGFRCVAKSP